MRAVDIIPAVVVVLGGLVGPGSEADAQRNPFELYYEEAEARTTAALWEDYDGDGQLDLVFLDHENRTQLYLGLPASTTGTLARLAHIAIVDGVAADFDNDGDPDLVIASLSNRPRAFRNTAGAFAPAGFSITSAENVRGVTALDANNDGELDFFFSRRTGHVNQLLLHTEAGYEVASGDQNVDSEDSSASCWTDLDLDGDLDGYVVNSSSQPNAFYVNEGGALRRAGAVGDALSDALTSTSCTWGDADGDGDFDLFVAGANGAPSLLYLNTDGRLDRAPESMFVPPAFDILGPAWGDVDNDGDLDLVVAARDHAAVLYRNEAGVFVGTEVSPSHTQGIVAVAAALADYDSDGDLDLALAAGGIVDPRPSLLFQNVEAETGAWLSVGLDGTGSNRDGIGARVEAFARIEGEPRRIVRQRESQAARGAQAGPWIHVGLGDASVVDSLVVAWPSGIRQVLTGLPVNAHVDVVEAPPPPTSVESGGAAALSLTVSPNPSPGRFQIVAEGVRPGRFRAEVFDARGRRVWADAWVHGSGAPVRAEIDSGHLKAGVYVVRIWSGSEQAEQVITLVR